MKVISTSPTFAKYCDEPVRILEQSGIGVIQLPSSAEVHELITAGGDTAEAMITGYTAITAPLLDRMPKLKIICKHGVGVDNIDLEAAKIRGIYVTNVQGANTTAVADYTIGLLLSLARRIPVINQKTKVGEWPQILGTEMAGKTLGVVGLGRIGKQVVRRASGFDMRIVAYDPFPDTSFAKEYNVTYTGLPELLMESDFITLHMPLTDQTRHLIGMEQIALMKESAFLVNVARGGLIDEEALYQSLQNCQLAGCALDVFEEEPLLDHPLFALDNCLVTPHSAGYTREAIAKIGIDCAENIVNVLMRAKRPLSIVNGL